MVVLMIYGKKIGALEDEYMNFGRFQMEERFIIGNAKLSPFASGIMLFAPAAGPDASDQMKDSSLILAGHRTSRPDVLNGLKLYRGGWDFMNRHYWASVGFTGAAGFIVATLWFFSFGLALVVVNCFRLNSRLQKRKIWRSGWLTFPLLVIFTSLAIIGCVVLSFGQAGFHDKVSHTVTYVVNQSDFTIEILKNVSDYLSLAKSVNVEKVFLPSSDRKEIDDLNVELRSAANVLTEKTAENSAKIQMAQNAARYALVIMAAVMIVLSTLGLFVSIFRFQHAIYIFILSGWLLVTVTFILFGIFVILNNAITDTCLAMGEWVDNPQAESALSDILPCVDESTTNKTLYQSKEIIQQLVNVINTAITTTANSNSPSQLLLYYYNQSGPLMPTLCSPFDSDLHDRECLPGEVEFSNATEVWLGYTCMVSSDGLCTSTGRVTPEIYSQLITAVNVSYALYHYTPFLLSLENCNFVRDSFNTITKSYCPPLEYHLDLVNAGLVLIAVGVLLCLLLWLLYANRPRREKELAKQQQQQPVSTTASNTPQQEV